LYEPYARGGAEQVVKSTIDYFVSMGNEVILITSAQTKEEIVENGKLKIYRIKQKNICGFLDLYKHSFLIRFVWHLIDMFNFGIAKKVGIILQQEKVGVVHTHNLMGLSFLIPQEIRKLKIKNIHTVHDVQLVEPSGIILKAKEKTCRYRGWFMKMHILVMKNLVGSPDVVISPSQFLLNFYKEKGFFENSKLKLLANPLTFDFPNIFSKEKHEGFNFLYVGQIEKHKGIFELLEVFQNIKNATLHIVGDGTQLDFLKKQFQDFSNIKFYGRLNREDLSKIFSKIDVTIFSSICYENYPAVIFESFYFATPVLTCNHSSLPEFVKVGENGWLFDIEKENDLAEKLQWCLENKTDIQKMSENFDTKIFKKNSDNYFFELLNLYK